MNERLRFLLAARADPDDRALRLVFADWLADHGQDDQAELIRVQTELDAVRDNVEELRVRELLEREAALLAGGGPFGALEAVDLGGAEVGYRGGLPDWLLVSLATLRERGERLFSAMPTLRELAVYCVEGRGAELAACPLLARVDSLEVADGLTEGDARALAASPHVRAVQTFRLYADWDHRSGELADKLARASTRAWPRRIDLVCLGDGLLYGIRAEEMEPLAEDESYAYPINEAAGRELAHDIRPALRLFPLRGGPAGAPRGDPRLGVDLGGFGVYAGRLPDGTPTVAMNGQNRWAVATFREDGLLREVTYHDHPELPANLDLDDLNALGELIQARERQFIEEALRLSPAVVRVREFETAGGWSGVCLWDIPTQQDLNNWGRRHEQPYTDWRGLGRRVSSHLRNGLFLIGDRYLADRRGALDY